ncbi:MAG: methyltransferase, partial [Nitrospinaceae bacterium]
TGCGIIPLLLASLEPSVKITAVEIQESLYTQAVRNVSQNGFSKQIRVVHGDFVQLADTFQPESFDLAVSNPPYRKINTGRINPHPEKAVARHELSLNLGSLIRSAAGLLTSGGNIVLAYPPSRLGEVLEELVSQNLFPSRMRFVHGSKGAEARIFLVEAVQGQKTDCVVQDPLYVYNRDGTYTMEMEGIYDSFNHFDRPDHIEEKSDGDRPG